MSNSVQDKVRRGPGRPKQNGRGHGLLVRVHPPQLRELDRWISLMGEPMTRAEALRRLAALAVENMKYRPPDERARSETNPALVAR